MNMQTKITMAAIGLIFAQTARADLMQDSSALITGEAARPKTVRTVPAVKSGNDAFKLENSSVKSTDNTLRCWQNGVLILAEHHWEMPVAANSPLLTNARKQKAYAFNYDETFCFYIGD